MGSSTSKTNATTTQNQTQTPVVPSYVSQPLQSDIGNIMALSNVPASSYVAPQTALQQQANAQGSSTLSGTNPNYSTAAGTLAANSGIGASDISKFLSPYLQNVLNSSNAQFDQNSGVQNAELEAQGAASGAFGGSRFGVAQGVLGGQQALARGQLDSNILNTGYNTATQTALSNAQQGLNTGIAQGNLGSQQNASNIANIAELANLGGAQQATNQAVATAPIALAQAQTGLLGSLPLTSLIGQNLTGTGSSTGTTTNNPSIFSDILGSIGTLGSLFSGGSNSAASGMTNFAAGF